MSSCYEMQVLLAATLVAKLSADGHWVAGLDRL